MEFNIHNEVLSIIFVTALIMGAVVNKTNFCTMGAVSDWVNMGDKGRLRAWLLAMAVAMAGVLILEAMGILNIPSNSFPPYRTANFAWLRYVLGGFMFGIGMTLGSGCGNKTLIRLGAGNLKSGVVLILIALSAYLMLWTNFFNTVFMSWMGPTSIDLAARGISSQELGAVVGGLFGAQNSASWHMVLGVILVLALLAYIFKSADFRTNRDNVVAGIIVGLAILVGWYVTGGHMGKEWFDWADFAEVRPSRVAVQSYTFISPTGDSVRYLQHPGDFSLINFGIIALVGVIAGSFLYAVISRSFRVEWFANGKDFVNHAVGGVLMGIGGVLGMGCTIGQGVTGVSTMAIGSMLTLVSIIFGSALTMKVQFNMLDEQGFLQALRSSLADMRLLPAPAK